MLLLTFTFFSTVVCKSQEYKDYKKIHKIYTKIHVADSLYEAKDYKNAIKFYKKANDGYHYEEMMLSQIARCYLALGDTLSASKIKIRKPKVEENINEELRAEFLKRKVTDQMRGSANNDSLWKIQKEYDKDNQRFLDSLIDKYGCWLGISILGQDGASAAFLFAQHADNDVKFQEKCLKFMKKALVKNDVPRHDYAYLMDRIMLKKHGFQLFGSQCMEVDSILQSRPLYDERIIKTLRKYFWMNPLEEYLEYMQNRYSKKEQNEE